MQNLDNTYIYFKVSYKIPVHIFVKLNMTSITLCKRMSMWVYKCMCVYVYAHVLYVCIYTCMYLWGRGKREGRGNIEEEGREREGRRKEREE